VDVILGLGLFAAIMGIAWALVRPSYAFVVQIKGGKVQVIAGKVTTAFLQQVEQTCREFGVSRGWVGGIMRGRKTRLAFARSIPLHVQQRLRNLWCLRG
jgi:hypothetical protein